MQPILDGAPGLCGFSGKDGEMRRPTGFSAIRSLIVLGGAAFCVAWASGQLEGDGDIRSGPADLLAELRYAQFVAPPCQETLVYDAGDFVLAPGGTDNDEGVLAAGMLGETDIGGRTVWPVTVREERETRDTVFLNLVGGEILRLPPAPGYSPLWILDALYPAGDAPAEVASSYDPSCVVMTARLHLPGPAPVSGGPGAPSAAAPQAARPLPGRGGMAEAGNGPTVNRAACGGASTDVQARSAVADSKKGPGPGAVSSGGRTLYVNSDLGDDSQDGLSAVAKGGGRGPKASVRQAIAAAGTGDVIEISGRAALPDSCLEAGDKRLRLFPVGVVRF